MCEVSHALCKREMVFEGKRDGDFEKRRDMSAV